MTDSPEPNRNNRRLFTGWLLGPKRFSIVTLSFFLILFAETWWTWQELAARANCPASWYANLDCWALHFPRALVAGLVTASFCLVSLWFINYAIPEVCKMIAEMFKQQRYETGLQRGLKQGLEQGRQEGRQEGIQQAAAQQKAWEGWNRRRETAQANNQPFTEPPPTLDPTSNGHNS